MGRRFYAAGKPAELLGYPSGYRQGNFLEPVQVLETQLGLEVCLLQAGLDGAQEATCVCTVDHAVVVGEDR